MLISLISLTMTATFLSFRLFKMWVKRVVLPAPKKTESTVTGSFFMVIARVVGMMWVKTVS